MLIAIYPPVLVMPWVLSPLLDRQPSCLSGALATGGMVLNYDERRHRMPYYGGRIP